MTINKVPLILVLVLIFFCTACIPPFYLSSSDSARSDDERFNIQNCKCAGISIPPNPNNSTASAFLSPLNLRTGETVEIQRHLACRWEEDYQSENLTGKVNLSLQIYLLDSGEAAAAMFEAARIEIDEDRSYCLEDAELCTIGTAQFREDRILFTEGSIYIRGDGEMLPSSHIGDLARIFEDIDKNYFIRATVTHPEKHLGDDWAMDQVLALDHCALFLIEN